MNQMRPYAIKNERGASKIPQVGGILRSIRGLWMPELVLHDIGKTAGVATPQNRWPSLQWASLPCVES